MKTFWLMMAMSMATAAHSAAADEAPGALRHKAAHLLQNGILRVEVMDPVDPGRYNTGIRFSSVANVLRVTMNGKDFLFSPVEHNPLADNCGLASEYDIGKVTKPPGYDGAAVGGGFLKIGVGFLRKGAEGYTFFGTYPLLQAAPTQATWGDTSAHFKQACATGNGYAYKLAAGITLKGNMLVIDYELGNPGEKPLVTEQYAHNFFSFDGAPVGPNYVVHFPCDFDVKGLQPEQAKQAREIDFDQAIPPRVKAVSAEVTLAAAYQGPNQVTIANPVNGMSVTATVSRPGERLVLHATPRYLCPEQFVLIDVAPGETQRWSRTYEFRDTGSAAAKP